MPKIRELKRQAQRFAYDDEECYERLVEAAATALSLRTRRSSLFV